MFEFNQIRCVILTESDWNSIIFRIYKHTLFVQFQAILVIFLSVRMIWIQSFIVYKKKQMLISSRITQVHYTKKHECLNSIKLGALFSLKVIEIQ